MDNMNTNPGRILTALMNDHGLSEAMLADRLSVPISVVTGLLEGDSPDPLTLAIMSTVFLMPGRFWRVLYSAPGNFRDAELSAILRQKLAA